METIEIKLTVIRTVKKTPEKRNLPAKYLSFKKI